jgi:hypothetical protein
MRTRLRTLAWALALFGLGLGCGGYLFADSQPRPLLPVGDCTGHCQREKELLGMVTSAAVLRTPKLVPGLVLDSDTCLSIKYPRPSSRVHYVLFPKHDIRNIASLSADDVPYVLGCFAMVRELVARDGLQDYVVYTNGPGRQEIDYLHFHLEAQRPPA